MVANPIVLCKAIATVKINRIDEPVRTGVASGTLVLKTFNPLEEKKKISYIPMN